MLLMLTRTRSFKVGGEKETNAAVVVKKYSADRVDECVSVLADAFVSSPLHLSAFGNGRIDQNRLFFRIGLRHMFIGPALIALVDGAVCGYVHFNAWPYCLPAPVEIPNVAATLLKPLGEAIPQIVEWFARWCHLDPEAPHVHLGPIGVAPGMQGKGVGRALMNHYIEYLKRERTAGYLETDRLENVEFYKKFGFIVKREEMIIGTPTWYMWRPIG
ncbi:MAG: GNAT family N-acetyltransferase [Candidatus Binatia bacterium]